MQGSQPIHQDDPVRWGILSSANIGVKAVAPSIIASSNGQLMAVASRDEKRAADLYSFAPQLRIYNDYEQIIQDPEIDAIYNPLPNSLHAEWTIKALQAGKHVLCEKPLAVTAEEATSMVEAAHTHNMLLMEAFMYRFHPQIVWALEQAHSGVVGPIRLVRASFSFDLRAHPENIRMNAELAGGSLMDIGCYGVNLCRAVYGHPPRAVAARVHAPKVAAVDMATNAVLDFGDGRFGLIDSSFALTRRQSAEIIGEQGTIVIPVPFVPGIRETTVFVTKNGQMNEQTFPIIDQYQLEVEHFSQCIRSHAEPARRLSETLENIATIEAIYQAAGHDWPLI
jgi:D-xylose 1-dehydrogenase (NADP+, D-xylono-1,5-lactone-forming)